MNVLHIRSSVFLGFGKDLGFGIVFVACMQAPRGFSEFSVVEKYRYKRYIRQMRGLYKNTKKILFLARRLFCRLIKAVCTKTMAVKIQLCS